MAGEAMKKVGRRGFLAGAIAAPLAYSLHEVLAGHEPVKPVDAPRCVPDDPRIVLPEAPPIPPGALEPQYGDPCPPCGMARVPDRSREFLRLQAPVPKPPRKNN